MSALSTIKIWSGGIALAVSLVLGFVSVNGAFAQQQVDPAQVARLHRIMAPLLAEMDNPIPMNRVNITFMGDRSINAANSGGGNFFVTAGLLQRANDDQLRAVTAHEVAHADRNHAVHQSFLNSGIDGTPLIDRLIPGSGMLGRLLSAQYSQGDEYEADAHAVELLKRAGFDGKRVMADGLSWLGKQEGASGTQDGIAGFFSTHPLTGDRVRAIREMR